MAIQVHGGSGFIEETGVAQYYRDARILPIYEGTNGIQAADLAFRKVLRDGGAVAKAYIADMKERSQGEHYWLFEGCYKLLEEATDVLVAAGKEKNMDLVAAMSVPYLKAFGIIACSAMMARRSTSGQNQRAAEFYITNILPFAEAHLKAATDGGKSIAA